MNPQLEELARVWNFTYEETAIVEELAQCLTYRVISESHGITERAVQFHAMSIYRKLGVGNRSGFTTYLTARDWYGVDPAGLYIIALECKVLELETAVRDYFDSTGAAVIPAEDRLAAVVGYSAQS